MTAANKSSKTPEKSTFQLPISATETTSIFHKDANTFKRQQLTQNQIKHATNSLTARLPSTISNTLELFLPNAFYALKASIVNKMSEKCKSLCKVNNGSVLYGHNYDSLAEFKFSSIWEEIMNNNPFFIDVLSGMSGVCTDFIDVPENVKIKFCFIYAILMNIRWSKLSVMQRMNATMMIEGGGSRKVSSFSVQYFFRGTLHRERDRDLWRAPSIFCKVPRK